MTTEHKILRLIDSRITSERAIEEFVGVSRETSIWLWRLHKDGLTAPAGPKGEHLSLTPKGVERLNELDALPPISK